MRNSPQALSATQLDERSAEPVPLATGSFIEITLLLAQAVPYEVATSTDE